jgi:hypothetical protein
VTILFQLIFSEAHCAFDLKGKGRSVSNSEHLRLLSGHFVLECRVNLLVLGGLRVVAFGSLRASIYH